MPLHARAPLALLAAVVVAGIACGGGDSSGPPSSGRKTVLVVNSAFQPTTANISVGDTILWSWAANSIDHNILSTGAQTFVSLGDSATTFDSPKSYQVVFAASGTFAYYCSTHGGPGGNGMFGQVVVSP